MRKPQFTDTMIAYKGSEVKKGKKSQMARNLERLYREAKCRDCSVIVTRMDFAKILGKFTKVKIQYENLSSPKSLKVLQETPPKDITRMKNNENGVLNRRNAYNKHPINNSQLISKRQRTISNTESCTPRQGSNVLKENNGYKKSAILKDKNSNYNTNTTYPNTKQYAIIFVDPKNNNKDCVRNLLLTELLPKINKDILPSEDWCIEYLSNVEQSRNDKVYDRIEAELEGLMFSEKPEEKSSKLKQEESKADDFPSIMDILNDNYSGTEPKQNDRNVIIDFKNNLESSDVEAMLLGKPTDIKISESTPMEVDSVVMSKLIEDVENISAVASIDKNCDKSEQIVELSIKENPKSPSILDETLRKGVEEHIPAVSLLSNNLTKIKTDEGDTNSNVNVTQNIETDLKMEINLSTSHLSDDAKTNDIAGLNPDVVSHVIFKKLENEGKCTKSVTCGKNLKYIIELDGKAVEFLGAPKYISSIEDLQVLLQIANESSLDSLYVLP